MLTQFKIETTCGSKKKQKFSLDQYNSFWNVFEGQVNGGSLRAQYDTKAVGKGADMSSIHAEVT